MPYVVVKDTVACPRPGNSWAVKTQGTDHVHGCHSTRESGLKQAAALYANVPDAKSAAPEPPNLRDAASGSPERCATCHMFDAGHCWGFGNYPVQPSEVCDAYSREPEAKADTLEVPSMPDTNEHPEERKRARLASHTIEWRKEKAELLSKSERKRSEPRHCAAELELREDTGRGIRTLRSYAALFDTPYTVNSANGYRFEETVQPGAFRRSLSQGPDVVFRTEHRGPPLAATWNGTLRLGEDQRGFWYEADLDPSDSDVQALLPKIANGTYRESSFAFRAIDDEWNEDMTKRALKECAVDRGDVSVVTYGASPATGAHMLLRSEEDLEELRAMGFEAFLVALVDWRNYTLLPREDRIGAMISSSSMDTLMRVLNLISAADDAVDDAQPLLADLLGVPNPDEDDEGSEYDEGADVTSAPQLGHLGRSEDDERKDFSDKDRAKLAASGAALPDGSFPIENVSDLKNAIQAVGRAKDPAAARAHIKKRAAALGATSLIPDGWREAATLLENDTEDLRIEHEWQTRRAS